MLNWAIIGCGVISINHATAVVKANGTKLYAVCDLDKGKAETLAREFGAEKVYTDYLELLRDPAVDVVSICTPSGIHGEMAIAAAKNGKHILCEKPVEITREKIDAIASAVEEAGVKLGCVYQLRYSAGPQAVKQYIETHDLGKLLFGRVYAQNYRSADYYKSATWRATWDLDGGGCLMNQGVHALDLLRWMMGDVVRVTANCKTLSHDIAVEDTALAIAEFTSGALASMVATTAAAPAQSMVSLHFEKGTIDFYDKECHGAFLDETLPPLHLKVEEEILGAENKAISHDSHIPMVQDLADAIREDRAPAIPLSEGRKSVELILGIYESSKTGKPVTL
ncbi:MAG: Gfo/Idh/MocA family oxidoreductase [Oscillospiraceae bacterium]|nr:Gfo/Idh/MocA family oxidoreductase [Oscillospiraceae bacterium]